MELIGVAGPYPVDFPNKLIRITQQKSVSKNKAP